MFGFVGECLLAGKEAQQPPRGGPWDVDVRVSSGLADGSWGLLFPARAPAQMPVFTPASTVGAPGSRRVRRPLRTLRNVSRGPKSRPGGAVLLLNSGKRLPRPRLLHRLPRPAHRRTLHTTTGTVRPGRRQTLGGLPRPRLPYRLPRPPHGLTWSRRVPHHRRVPRHLGVPTRSGRRVRAGAPPPLRRVAGGSRGRRRPLGRLASGPFALRAAKGW